MVMLAGDGGDAAAAVLPRQFVGQRLSWVLAFEDLHGVDGMAARAAWCREVRRLLAEVLVERLGMYYADALVAAMGEETLYEQAWEWLRPPGARRALTWL